MLQKLLLLATMLTVVAVSGVSADVPPADQVLVWYMGNTNPTAANSAGSGMSFVLNGDASMATVVSGPVVAGALDGLALHIDDASAAGVCWFRLSPDKPIDHIGGATIVGRVKVDSDTHGATSGAFNGNIGIHDNATGMSARYHYGGSNAEIGESERKLEGLIDTGDADWHILRMTTQGRLYGDPVVPYSESFEDFSYLPLPEFPTDPGAPLAGQQDWVGAPNGSLAVTDLSGRKVVILTSGEACNAMYRVLGAPKVDNTMSVTVYIKAGAVVTGNMWKFWVNNADGENLGQWYGSAGNATPRMNDGPVLASSLLTGVDTWDKLTMVINASEKKTHFFFNDVEVGTGMDITLGGVRNPDISIGQVTFDLPWALPYNDTVYFDDVAVDAAPMTEGFRTIKFYLDENPEPVWVVGPASGVSRSNDGFMFGCGSNSSDMEALQDIYFDWVTASNRGAFAPGEEVAVIGKSLVPDATTPLTTILQAKLAEDARTVDIPAAIVTAFVKDDGGGRPSFGIEESNRHAGIRVVWAGGGAYSDVAQGCSVHVVGATATVNGERVISASAVTVEGVDPVTLEGTPVLYPDLLAKALAMGTKAAVGGPSIVQAGTVDCYPSSTETFLYDNGALVGNVGWTGAAGADKIAVDNSACKLIGGSHPTVPNWGATLDNPDPLSTEAVESFEFKATPGANTNWSNCWRMYLMASNGIELGSFYGGTANYRPRILGSVGSSVAFSPGGNTLKITADFTQRTMFFYVDGAQVWTAPMLVAANNEVGDITLNWMSNVGATGTLLFDDLQLPFSAALGKKATGANNVGLRAVLCGKVTARNATGRFELDTVSGTTAAYFYVDDGSGVWDGTLDAGVPVMGVRCRAPSEDGDPNDMPNVGDTVRVEGIMGMQGRARFLWTWNWDLYTP